MNLSPCYLDGSSLLSRWLQFYRENHFSNRIDAGAEGVGQDLLTRQFKRVADLVELLNAPVYYLDQSWLGRIVPKIIEPLESTWIRNGKTVQAHKVFVLGEEGPNRAELVSEVDEIEQVKFHNLQVAQL